MYKRACWVGLVLLLQLILTFSWWTPTAVALTEEQQLITQSWRIVNESYLDDSFNHQNWWLVRKRTLDQKVNDREAAYQAIQKMLATLEDPFTRFLTPEQYRSLQVNTSGELSGVGLQIALDDETHQLQVVAPIAGSPAEAAGIKSRDRIVTIDGIPTTELTLDEAAARMRGTVGTSVTLTVQRQKEPPTEIQLVRSQITLQPVYAELRQPAATPPVGYIRLTQFSANAPEEFKHAVNKLEQQGAKAYILDLRNNPGGLLQAGIQIADFWLDQGTIVYTVDRQGIIGNFDTSSPALTNAPLVVLVNQGTASASEILAGALQDNHRAQIVGETTFGKGLIQSLFDLPDGSGLAVTIAKYETPNHRDINKLGITPDRVVPIDSLTLDRVGTEADEQYQVALRQLTVDS